MGALFPFPILYALPILFGLVAQTEGMRLDPERLAARMRIEEGGTNGARNRRQLGGTPKEETIQVTAQLFSGRLFEYGREAGDKELPAGLDAGKRLQLTHPLSFYGKTYSQVHVFSNGGIGFDSNSREYKSNVLPGKLKLIAPFWNRNDLRNGGKVHYREVTLGRAIDRGQSEIRYQYDKEVKVHSAIVATWEKMQPLGTAPLPDENTNTFQAVIFVTSNGTFANFIYSNIGWTQGAESGFSAGDGSRHFALPTSGTGNIMYLEDYGNTGIPGEWMFIFGDDRIIRCKPGIKGDTCDETCGNGQWGADCAGCCHCAGESQSCNNVTGECNTGFGCASCYTGFNCQEKADQCKNTAPKPCVHNAISFTDYDRCGEPTQRCECIAGYEGNGNVECRDVDECAQPGSCHEKAVCTNTPGRYFCQCQEGFSGDGVTECVASFLYPHEGGQKLPKSKNSKVAWQLKNPMKIFGKERDRIIVSTSGLIIVKELSRVNPGDQLDDMEILGIAPFFSPIDLSSPHREGEVSIVETSDSDVLTRVTKSINENLLGEEATFKATSVVTVSFMNVTTAKAKAANTFQTLLIGGFNARKEPLTFVQFLYKDLMWSEGAEAGIMTIDKTNSIHLPGSGTPGIEQLSTLSNVRSPGIWLYRIDQETVVPCMQAELQPPYCDAQSPTLIGSRRPVPVTQPATTTIPSTSLSPFRSTETRKPAVSSTTKKPRKLPIFTRPIPTQVHEEDDEEPFKHVVVTTPDSPPLFTRLMPAFPQVETRHWSEPTQKTPVKSTKKPIVPLNSREIEEQPPDVFEFTSPFITVIPKLFPTETTTTVTTTEAVPIIKAVTEEKRNEWPVRVTAPKELFTPGPETKHGSEGGKPRVEFDNDERVIEIQPQQTIIPVRIQPPQSEPITTTSTMATTIATKPTMTVSSDEAEETSEGTTFSSPTTNGHLFVFSTLSTRPSKPMATKPKLVTNATPKFVHKEDYPNNNNVDGGANMPFDPNRVLDVEAAGNKLSIMIPVAIVFVWLVILVMVAGFLCCQRRRNQHTLRTMYGPAYQIRPVPTGYTTRGGDKHFDSYEDHLEKAARLNSEMNAYNPGGRISHYGSYWNLSSSNASNGSSTGGGVGRDGKPSGGLTSSRIEAAASALAYNSHLTASPPVSAAITNPRSATQLPFSSTQRYGHQQNGRH